MSSKLPHEGLDVYQLYLEVSNDCAEFISSAGQPIVAFDHLDRAMESIGINLMRGNAMSPGSARRNNYLDVSIASGHECAACLDICLARSAVTAVTYDAVMGKLWRIRGMLLGLKRVGVNEVCEGAMIYGTPRFPFVGLKMYQDSLAGVGLVHDLLAELVLRTRVIRKLDVSTTGTVLNIAEGHGRVSAADQNRFMRLAQEHAYQTLLMLDLMVARNETTEAGVAEVKETQRRVISMLRSWCLSNEKSDEADARAVDDSGRR